MLLRIHAVNSANRIYEVITGDEILWNRNWFHFPKKGQEVS